MRDILLSLCPTLLWIITAVHLVLMIVLFGSYARRREILFLLSGLVVLGLFYDALILSLGTLLDEGPLLAALSRARFVLHGALIPLLFMICAYALVLNARWTKIMWCFTAVLIVLGIAEGFAVDLAAQHVAGVVRYTSGDGTPAWAQAVSGLLSYGTVVPLIVAGVIVWAKQKTPALFLSGFLMFLFSALGPATGNFDLIFFISMFGEIFMALFFLIYARYKANSK